MWQGTCQLPGYELAEYKYVVRTGWAPDAECWWQGGPNNSPRLFASRIPQP